MYPVRVQRPAPTNDFWARCGQYQRTRYNPEGCHLGIDCPARDGDVVQSPVDGRISWRGAYGDLGNVVRIVDGQGHEWWLCHLLSFGAPTQGQEVAAGRSLGRADQTGRASGPHVHVALLAAPLANRAWGEVPYLNPYHELADAYAAEWE